MVFEAIVVEGLVVVIIVGGVVDVEIGSAELVEMTPLVVPVTGTVLVPLTAPVDETVSVPLAMPVTGTVLVSLTETPLTEPVDETMSVVLAPSVYPATSVAINSSGYIVPEIIVPAAERPAVTAASMLDEALIGQASVVTIVLAAVVVISHPTVVEVDVTQDVMAEAEPDAKTLQVS